MQQQWQNVHTGHKVLDRDGKNIGTVRNVHQQALAAGGKQLGELGYVEIDCTLPNLRQTLYIPLDSFGECTGNSCKLNVGKDDIVNRGWDRKPSNL